MADEIELDEADLLPIEGEEAPVAKQTLDDVISQALDGAETAEDAPSDGRTRDEKGRFAPKTESEVAAAPDDGTSESKPPVASTEQPDQNAKPEPVSEGHFRGWSPEQREAFGKLPPEAQKTVLDVVKGRDQFYGERVAEYDHALKAVSPLVNAIRPHVGRIQQATNDIPAYVAHVLDIDHKLKFAPYAEKVQLFAQLADKIGVPFSPPQPDVFADPLSVGGEAYPIVHDLRNQVTQLESRLRQYESRTETTQQEQTNSHIRSFAAMTNADGTPAHPYFETVKGTMGQLIESGRANSLEEAYAIAVKPIEDAIAQRVASTTRQTQAASQAALEKARRAMPIKKTGMVPGGKTKGGGLDSIISGALDQAGFN